MPRRYSTAINVYPFVVLAAFYTFGQGSSLWDDLYRECGQQGSFYCVQDRLMHYINTTLDSDLRVTDGIYFVKSTDDRHHPPQYSALVESGTFRQRRSQDADGELPHSLDAEEKEYGDFVRSVESLGNPLNANSTDRKGSGDGNFVIRGSHQVSDILYEKTTKYLSTHDLRLDMPSFMFGGLRMVVSPRGVDRDGGIMLKLNFNPSESGRKGVGKFFHKIFKKKLLTSFLALLLIIKLIKIKLLYVLPVLIGVGAAKKLLLKTMLFLFPPLIHLFKMCKYYHSHGPKLHFHHLKIKHHLHPVPVPIPVPVPDLSPEPHYDVHGDQADGSVGQNFLNHDQDVPYDPSLSEYNAQEADSSYYTRDDHTSDQYDTELANWGLRDFFTSTEPPGVFSGQAQDYSPYAENNFDAADEASVGSQIYVNWQKKKKVPTRTPWKTKSGNQGSDSIKNTLATPYDPFYTPAMHKIDSIFQELGFNDERCKERLICSMYKDPNRFSPYSNLLSTELSRNSVQSEMPSRSNLAAIRYYGYVKAAKDGQSHKDCLALYQECAVKTE